MRKAAAGLAVAAIWALIVVTLFPPWTTIMGGYPKVGFHWVASRPPPIQRSGDGSEYFEYRVDVDRLERRYVVVLISFMGASAVVCFAGRILGRTPPEGPDERSQ